jgi:FPC/CPF motif-containing protein YcgG
MKNSIPSYGFAATNSSQNLVSCNAAGETEATAAPKTVKSALSPDGVTPIWTKAQLDGELAAKLPDWAREGVAEFRKVILSPGFPCFFAPSSERRGFLHYTFVETVHDRSDVAHLAIAVESFLEGLDKLTQFEADSTVLIVLVRPQEAGRDLKQYAEDANTLLSALRETDQAPWPADIPTDLDDPKWSYAFAGRALFVNVSTPANIARRSRNVGPCLSFIVSPRDVFDRVAGPDLKGQKVRSSIRERTRVYDNGLPFAPWSAVRYGDANVGMERKQYVLSDDNEHPIDFQLRPGAGCPFHKKPE